MPELSPTARRAAFVLTSCEFGAIIVNRLDFYINHREAAVYGVGAHLLETGQFEVEEAKTYQQLLELRQLYFGPGVVAVDCGANIGLHTIPMARAMAGWGSVLAIEPQERIFYALAGNLALGNHYNARALHAAVGATCGVMRIPMPDYQRPGSFGSLELKPSPVAEEIGQSIDYTPANMVEVRLLSLDSLQLARLDFIKIDVERMELDVLQGAASTIDRFKPIISVEFIKTAAERLRSHLEPLGYHQFVSVCGMMLAIHDSDPTVNHIFVN